MQSINRLLITVVLTLVAFTASAEAVNVNTATADELSAVLKGVGAKQAAAIVYYREQNGAFQAADDLANVPGIGAKTVEKNKNNIALDDMQVAAAKEEPVQISAAGQVPADTMQDGDMGLVNINTATVEELQKLVNVGPTRAAKIVEYREQNGPFASVDDLVKVSGISTKTLQKNKASLTVN
jgi:competence protein ComEA